MHTLLKMENIDSNKSDCQSSDCDEKCFKCSNDEIFSGCSFCGNAFCSDCLVGYNLLSQFNYCSDCADAYDEMEREFYEQKEKQRAAAKDNK